MESNIRRTGIDAIGDVPWGTHFCQFYETSQDLVEILVPYFKEGLASNEFCMWVTSEPLKIDQATSALRAAVPDLDNYIDKGQIEILDYSQWYTRLGKFSADEVLQGWVDKLKAAQERGYEGLRLTGNTFWLEKADWDDFTKYEETVNSIIGQYPMLAICTYSLQKCNALELLDVVANHQFALIKRSDQWEIIESTQHKKIEQAMRESEEKLSALYASMVEGVALHEIIYDESENPVDYVITDINPSYEKITGLSREKALGQKASELYGLNDPPYLDIYARVASSGKPESFETYFPPMKKHFSISVFSPARGKFATVFSDITERKQAEIGLQEANEELEVAGEELRQQNDELMSAQSALMDSEGRYRELVENANSIIIKMDQDGKITFFNDYSQKFFGYSLEEILGQKVKILVPPIENNGRNLEEMVDNILKNPNGFVENINENVRKNGDRVWISWRNKAIKDASGYIIGNLAVGQDITERKQMEMELLKAKDELEQKVQERTAELQEALEASEESVKAKAAFLANMSHELRTPMNAVLGFSSLLLDDTLTQEQKEYIEGIRKGGEALLAIINDILDFSRAEKHKIELEHQLFSLKHLIDESLDMVATQAGKKGLNLSQTINYGTPDAIIGDQGRLRQILVNLLTNAVKFTDNGDISISVSSKAVEGDRHQIFFKVKDTGIGIPQDKMNEIFEPFVQVERTLSRKRDGVGLGLAITKNLVELMGGRIWAESVPGQGATFHFTIQAETIPGKQLDFGRMDSVIATARFQGLKPMRILVAEDNPSNQRVLVEMLKRLGYRADAVADGREVIQALERQDYDLVLMDIKMPEMDGITATQVIRKLRPENGPKIVAITAFALEGDREKCLEAGMDDYIAKPVQMRELAEVLKKNQPSSAGP